MDKVKIEILGISSSQSQTSGSFALVLGETVGERRLPIIIGMPEAQAIALEIEKIAPNRPMTHDLFKSFAHGFEFHIKEVIISDLREGVFFAKIVCRNAEKEIEIDARPSDAIAIGIRFGVSFYTYEKVLAEAGIILTDEEDAEDMDERMTVEKSDRERIQDYSLDDLRALLDEALYHEDYEKAAKLRDEMNRRS